MAEVTDGSVFRRICQVAAVADSNKLEETLDWLIVVMMFYDEGPWRSADDWFEAIEESFGLDLALSDITKAIQRAVDSGKLRRDSFGDEYRLTGPTSKEVEERLEEADDLEQRIQERWLEATSQVLQADEGAVAWLVLLDYAAKAFRSHGSDALELLKDSAVDSIRSDRKASFLQESMASHSISRSEYQRYSVAVDLLFESVDAETIQYVTQLADSTFSLMALTADEDVRAELASKLPELRLFLDTNVLFALLGTHDTPLSAATVDLARVIQDNDLPFKLLCHSKTLQELEHTLDAAINRLTKQAWSQAVSRALVKLPYQVSKISGIEMRFHQLNAAVATSPSTFCTRFANPLLLLEQHGIKVFRDNPVKDNQERLEFRSTIIDYYEEYLKTHQPKRWRVYEKLDHDAVLWITAKDYQQPSNKGPLHVGSFAVTTDYSFWRFDRQVMRPQYGTKPVVVLPDMLLQALRPFVGRSVNFDDAAFSRIFATAEMRVGGVTGVSQILQRVAGYLATFEGLPEETATQILTDSLLLERIRKIESEGASLGEAVDQAIVAQNEELRRGFTDLLEERQQHRAGAARALEVMKESGGGNPEAEAILRAIAEQSGPPIVISLGNINLRSDTVTHEGDVFNNEKTQIVAQGRGASGAAENLSMDNRSVDFGNGELLEELSLLKQAILNRASTSEDYAAVAAVQEAVEFAQKKSDNGVIVALKKAGQKALEVATELGMKFALKAIEAGITGS